MSILRRWVWRVAPRALFRCTGARSSVVSRRLSTRGATRSTALEFDVPYELCGRPQPSTLNAQPLAGFSLLEVLIAMAVFFIVVFAILGMVVQSVGAARALQHQTADPSMVAAMFSLSNKLEEGHYSGDLEGVVADYLWDAEVYEIGSNGLYQIDMTVRKKNARGQVVGETMSMYKYTGQSSKQGLGMRQR